jgi:hypothetical protein
MSYKSNESRSETFGEAWGCFALVSSDKISELAVFMEGQQMVGRSRHSLLSIASEGNKVKDGL